MRTRVTGYIQPLLVFSILGALGVWGHRTGWKAPKWSELLSSTSAAQPEDWCGEHNVPESRCIKCHPELLGESMKDWCREHGVAESKCTLCHPDILKTGVAGDWCREHGLPESSCTLCHPEIAVKGKLPAQKSDIQVTRQGEALPATPKGSAEASGRSTAGSNPATQPSGPSPRRSGYGRAGEKDPKTCQTHALRVQFASAAAVRKTGVQLGQVVRRPMRAVVSAHSEIEYDRTRFIQLSAPVSGRVWRVDREVGQPVKAGDTLALIDSAEVGKQKAELLEQLAEVELKSKTYERLQTLADSAITSQAAMHEAAAALKVARIRAFNAQQALTSLGLLIDSQALNADMDERQIRFLGLPEELVRTLHAATTANLIPLRAPLEGTVIARQVIAGESVEPQKVLFTVADTGHMWVMIDIRQSESSQIRAGQAVVFRPDGVSDQSWSGRITWISTEVEDQTRTVRARAEVENKDGRLLAHTFGTAEIVIRETDDAVVVPTEAIQWEGCCHIVFVRLTDDIFQVRKVKLGASSSLSLRAEGKDDHFTEIDIGLLPGEVVATTGSHVLTSEILKSALGAGCCAAE